MGANTSNRKKKLVEQNYMAKGNLIIWNRKAFSAKFSILSAKVDTKRCLGHNKYIFVFFNHKFF